MNADEAEAYREFQKRGGDEPRISVVEVDPDKGNRTLLFGYTVERDTFHVYLLDGTLHRVIYRGGATGREGAVLDHVAGESLGVNALYPNKRAYPESTELAFVTLLSTRHEYDVALLPFDAEREARVSGRAFHGLVVDDGRLVEFDETLSA